MKLFKMILFGSAIALVLVSLGCSLQIPQSVRVKSDPTIQIPLGTKANLLSSSDGFDIDAELDALTDPASPDYIEGLSRVDVADGEPITLQMEVDVIDISVSDFAGDTLDLDSFETDNQNVSTSITVPSIEIPGITITTPAVPVQSSIIYMDITNDITINITTGAEFRAATIGTGNMTVTLDIPATWGINDQYEMTLTLYDASDLVTPLASETDHPGSAPVFPRNVVLDLSGVDIGQSNLVLSYALHLESTTNTADLSSPTNVASTSGSVDNFSMLQVDYPDFNQIDSFESPVDPEVADLLTSVTFNDPKLTFTVNNQLPIPIDINVDSTAMRTNETYTFNNKTLGDATPETHDYDLLSTVPTDTLLLPSPMDPIDFDINVGVIAPDTYAGTLLTINRTVLAGTTYSMTTSVDVVLDVASIVVSDIETDTYAYPEGPEGLDFSQLGDVLPDGIIFSGITSDLLLDLDPSVDNHIGLKLWSDYNADMVDDYHLGSEGTTPDTYVMLTGASVPLSGIDDALNARPTNLFFNYKVIAENIPISADGTDDQRIAASLLITLPLQIEATDDVELLDDNDEPLFPQPDEDIFGRDGADADAEDAEDLVNMLKSLSLHYSITNTFGVAVILVMEDPDSDFYKTFTLEDSAGVEQDLEFSEEDIAIIQGSNSFRPVIHLYIPQGEQSLNQGSPDAPADISITMWMELQTDVDYTLGGDE